MPKLFSELSKRQKNRRTLLSYNFDREVDSQPVLFPNDDGNLNNGPSCSSFEFEEQKIEDGIMETNFSQFALSETDSSISYVDDGMSSETSISHLQENLNLPLADKLCKWTNKFKINQNAVTSLLHILSRHGHNDLPLDARTLLKTPRPGTHEIKTLSKGQYVHYGLFKALVKGAYINWQLFFSCFRPYGCN